MKGNGGGGKNTESGTINGSAYKKKKPQLICVKSGENSTLENFLAHDFGRLVSRKLQTEGTVRGGCVWCVCVCVRVSVCMQEIK